MFGVVRLLAPAYIYIKVRSDECTTKAYAVTTTTNMLNYWNFVHCNRNKCRNEWRKAKMLIFSWRFQDSWILHRSKRAGAYICCCCCQNTLIHLHKEWHAFVCVFVLLVGFSKAKRITFWHLGWNSLSLEHCVFIQSFVYVCLCGCDDLKIISNPKCDDLSFFRCNIGMLMVLRLLKWSTHTCATSFSHIIWIRCDWSQLNIVKAIHLRIIYLCDKCVTWHGDKIIAP